MNEHVECVAQPDPLRLFASWYQRALDAEIPQPNAMALATATADGRPSARMVLLKSSDERGFVFHTNYGSRKGMELAANPWASLILFWVELHRQIRIEGSVERISIEESDAYFATRERGSQIAARASRQSSVLASREDLEASVARVEQEFSGRAVARPEYWGGYRVKPDTMEFWQGQRDRLHDRLLYRRDGADWTVEPLAP